MVQAYAAEETGFFDALEFHKEEFDLLNERSLDVRRVVDVSPEGGFIRRPSQLSHAAQVAFQLFQRSSGGGLIRDAVQDGDFGCEGLEELVVVCLFLSGADERSCGKEEDTRWEQTLHEEMIRGGSFLVKRFSPRPGANALGKAFAYLRITIWMFGGYAANSANERSS